MKVNWDDEIPNIWENKIDVPNHQPGYIRNKRKLLRLLKSMNIYPAGLSAQGGPRCGPHCGQSQDAALATKFGALLTTPMDTVYIYIYVYRDIDM